MAQIVDIAAARRAKSLAEAGGLSNLTQWRVIPDGRRERKEHAEMRRRAAKPFQFPGIC